MLQGKVLGAAGIVLGLLVAAIYTSRLADAPIYLTHDEVNFSLQGVSMARTGHDTNGRWLPVYFSEPEFPAGRDPLVIYAMAAVLTVMPLGDAAVRMPTALWGTFTVLALMWCGARLTGKAWWGVLTAVLLALTPGLFIHSRLALSVIYPLPFIIAWLAALHAYAVRPRAWLLALCGWLLGAAIYGYLAAAVMLPVYLALTLWQVRAWERPRVLVPLGIGVAVALAPAVLWGVAHPERYGDLLHAYRVNDPAAAAIPPLSSWAGARARLVAWWEYFNPDFLFLSGDTSITNSTRAVGFFPLAFAWFLPVGLLRLWRGTAFERLLIAALVTAPFAAVVTGTIDLNRYRAMFVLPFGAIVATFGVESLWHSRRALIRTACAVALLSVPAQFAGFYGDYMTRYRESSSVWFGRNIRAALAVVYEHPSPSADLLMSQRIPYADSYARFYSQVFGLAEAQAPVLIADERMAGTGARQGSWLIVGADESWRSQLSAIDWDTVSTITEPSGEASFVIYRRK